MRCVIIIHHTEAVFIRPGPSGAKPLRDDWQSESKMSRRVNRGSLEMCPTDQSLMMKEEMLNTTKSAGCSQNKRRVSRKQISGDFYVDENRHLKKGESRTFA